MYESMVKRMQHGFASRNGLTAAALAAAGYVGIKRVFERPYGGWLASSVRATAPTPKIFTRAWAFSGDRTDRGEAVRVHGLLHAAVDAALELRPQVDVSQIQRIDIDMAKPPTRMAGGRPSARCR